MKLKSNEKGQFQVTGYFSKNPNGAGSDEQEAKGTLPEEDLDYPLGRRLAPFINFYALNLIKPLPPDPPEEGEEPEPIDEDYHEIDWYVNPSISHTINREALEGNLEQVIVDLSTLNESHIEGLFEKIFEVPMEDWKKRYYKIPFETYAPFSIYIKDKEGDVYEITTPGWLVDYEEEGEVLYDALEERGIKWTTKGLKYDKGNVESEDPEEEPEPVFAHIAINTDENSPFFEFDTESDDYKITEEYDHTAEAVEWQIKPNMDIFLVPKYGLYYANATGLTDESIPLEKVDYHMWHSLLGLQYRTFPMEKHPKFVNHEVDTETETTDPYGYFEDFLNQLKSLSGSRGYVVERIYEYDLPTVVQHHSTDGESGLRDPSFFPTLGDYELHYLYRFVSFRVADLTRRVTVQPNDYTGSFNSFFIDEITTPQLCAVIKSGSKWLYVWNMQTGLDTRAEIFQYTGSAGELRVFYNT